MKLSPLETRGWGSLLFLYILLSLVIFRLENLVYIYIVLFIWIIIIIMLLYIYKSELKLLLFHPKKIKSYSVTQYCMYCKRPVKGKKHIDYYINLGIFHLDFTDKIKIDYLPTRTVIIKPGSFLRVTTNEKRIIKVYTTKFDVDEPALETPVDEIPPFIPRRVPILSNRQVSPYQRVYDEKRYLERISIYRSITDYIDENGDEYI